MPAPVPAADPLSDWPDAASSPPFCLGPKYMAFWPYRALQIDSPKTRQILLAFFCYTFLLATVYSLFTAYREKGVLHFLAIYECPEVSRVLHGLNQ